MDIEPPNSSGSALRDTFIDRVRDNFELEWHRNSKPLLEDYLCRIDQEAQVDGFCDLLRVELAIRRSRGDSPTDHEYRKRFPQFEHVISRVFAESQSNANTSNSEALTGEFSNSGEQHAAHIRASNPDVILQSGERRTIDHTPSRKESRGLHIRCPHCNNAVELLADTPYEEISCNSCGSMFSLVTQDESTRMATPLKTIDRFDLLARLGVGGFGTVWKARDRDLQRIVAIKIPRRGQLSSAEIEQFFREARSAAQLRHPNIVPVHEVGREGETLFIVSDFIRGVALSDWLTGNHPSPREVVRLCVPIARALHHAHEQGVIHRDLKPSNIMIDEQGQPWLMDFGLAKREVGEITMTMDGQILGTPRYMSPEQASGQGHSTDRRTDIYSMGVMFFEMLTGEGPFRGNAQMQIHQRLVEDAPDPRKLNRHIPRDLSTICAKCLERAPENRYSSAAELGDEFERFLRGEPIKARPISAPSRLARWARRKPWVASTAALTVVLAIAGPLTALNIESHRRQLEARFRERNEFIQKTKQDIDQANATITELEDKLSVWKGRAVPSELWPPSREKPPRQMLIAQLFDQTHALLLRQLQSGKSGDEPMARGYTALASMAESVENEKLASEYYQLARDALISLQTQNPEQPRFARALAQIEGRIADLHANEDRDQASRSSDHARTIFQQLATKQKPDAVSQIEWFESELNSAVLAGYEASKQHLVRADQIKRSLVSRWPSDPDAVYRLTCFLRREEPVLLAPTDGQAVRGVGVPISPSSR
jgi:serine/threonine protein kinase/ribosomal protein S27E